MQGLPSLQPRGAVLPTYVDSSGRSKADANQELGRRGWDISAVPERVLLWAALVADLTYPLLSWRLGVPSAMRLISPIALVLLGAIGMARAFKQGRVRREWLLLTMWMMFSVAQALLSGQSLSATALGVFAWLRYPLVGVYAYTRRGRDFNFERGVLPLILFVLAANTGIQLTQFLNGDSPGDSLVGFWGFRGSNNLATFVTLALAIAFGSWIVRGATFQFWITLVLCAVSSILAELKVFLVVLLGLWLVAGVMYTFRRPGFLAGIAVTILLVLSGLAYNRFYVSYFDPRGTALPSYLHLQNLIAYLSVSNQNLGKISYIGRWVQLQYTWGLVSRDAGSLLMGLGIGSLEASRSLGISGLALSRGSLGVFGAIGLTVLLGDFGLLGTVAMTVLLGRLAYGLFGQGVDENQRALNIGLALFTCTLPLLFFYLNIWLTPVTMLVFWYGVGDSGRFSARSPRRGKGTVEIRRRR